MERKLVYPAIYKHFKNKYYASIGIIKKMDVETIINNIRNNKDVIMEARHTETGDIYTIVKINNELYYLPVNPYGSVENRDMVLYKSLYDNHIAYIRPLNMFLSEVDKGKYPDIEQKYRFELIRY